MLEATVNIRCRYSRSSGVGVTCPVPPRCSIAAATHLAAGLQEMWREMGETSFSMVVRGTFEDQKPTGVDVLAGPLEWS